MAELWDQIHVERKAIIDDCENLTAAQWSTPSLCAGWTVHDLLAHQLATAKMTPGAFLGKFAGSGFSFPKMVNKDIARETAGGPTATLAAFKAVYRRTSSPPGPKQSWLGEALIHSEDMRQPLGLHRDYPMDALLTLLDFQKNSNAIIGSKKRIAGLSLRATDTSWSTGEGPLVEGPALALLMAMTGRKPHLDQLTGDGVEILRSR
jgi:uncharacterized protein (TIGR03083 family)